MNTTFGIGNVLVNGFRIWFKNIVAFVLITLLVQAPVLIWGVSSVRGELDDAGWQRLTSFVTYSPFAILVLNIIVSAALTYGVVMELQGRRASLGSCIATGFSRFFPALGTGLLLVLCCCGMAIVLAIPGMVVSPWLGVIGACIGVMWILSMLYVAIPASVIERPGVMGALNRSRALTMGHRFALFAIFLLLQLMRYGLQQLVESTALPDVQLFVYLWLAGELLVGSLGAVMASVAYYFLRGEKEGTSAEELAAVFA